METFAHGLRNIFYRNLVFIKSGFWENEVHFEVMLYYILRSSSRAPLKRDALKVVGDLCTRSRYLSFSSDKAASPNLRGEKISKVHQTEGNRAVRIDIEGCLGNISYKWR